MAVILDMRMINLGLGDVVTSKETNVMVIIPNMHGIKRVLSGTTGLMKTSILAIIPDMYVILWNA